MIKEKYSEREEDLQSKLINKILESHAEYRQPRQSKLVGAWFIAELKKGARKQRAGVVVDLVLEAKGALVEFHDPETDEVLYAKIVHFMDMESDGWKFYTREDYLKKTRGYARKIEEEKLTGFPR